MTLTDDQVESILKLGLCPDLKQTHEWVAHSHYDECRRCGARRFDKGALPKKPTA